MNTLHSLQAKHNSGHDHTAMVLSKLACATLGQVIARRHKQTKKTRAVILTVSALELLHGRRTPEQERRAHSRMVPMDWDHRFDMPDSHFRKRYRMTKAVFTTLVETVRPYLPKSRHRAEVVVSGVIRWIAGANFWDVCDMHGIVDSQMNDLIWQILLIVDNEYDWALPDAIHTCETQEGIANLQHMAELFEYKTSGILKGNVGAIDGIAIKIQKPKDAVKHWCRKGDDHLTITQ
jgi:hypothetical protein